MEADGHPARARQGRTGFLKVISAREAIRSLLAALVCGVTAYGVAGTLFGSPHTAVGRITCLVAVLFAMITGWRLGYVLVAVSLMSCLTLLLCLGVHLVRSYVTADASATAAASGAHAGDLATRSGAAGAASRREAMRQVVEIDAEINLEERRLKAATEIIDKLTNHKRLTPAEGSLDYYRCQDATRIIQETSRKIMDLDARKPQLKPVIQD